MSIDAILSVNMLSVCEIWSRHREDGVGYWEEPNTVVDDYIDFYLYLCDRLPEREIDRLLQPLFPQMEMRTRDDNI